MTEKRYHERITPPHLNGCVAYCQDPYRYQVDNISLGGVKLNNASSIPLASYGQLYLTLAGFGEILPNFKCVQKSAHSVGLQFTYLSDNEKQVLANYLNSVSSIKY